MERGRSSRAGVGFAGAGKPDRGGKKSSRRSKSPPENAKRSRSGKASRSEELIPDYDRMTPAERVKARMNFQLSQTAAKDKDTKNWERFDFDKSAPLDEEEEDSNPRSSSAGPDDTSSLRNTAGSYLSYSSQLTREKRTEAAHDAAMFGSGSVPKEEEQQAPSSHVEKNHEKKASDLLSEEVIAMQKDSWQERLRKMKAAKAAATGSVTWKTRPRPSFEARASRGFKELLQRSRRGKTDEQAAAEKEEGGAQVEDEKENQSVCPCGGGELRKSYESCCGVLHEGGAEPDALAVMKARFSAYARGNSDYVVKTTHKENACFQGGEARLLADVEATCRKLKFKRLEILDFQTESEDEALVSFKVTYTLARGSRANDRINKFLLERSRFVRSEDPEGTKRWLYIEGIPLGRPQ
ncbi:hypothetical protein SELMODRAFT_437618 [Selaginella moellendorffii]|uniref:YchJ-like middle NTF2-like domain-containing protein n=2 Tax=Selaginella moellendorffii TaxID=88036 RepID=D8QNF7_SELML|nr:hypothetical protein SELMODRAFT_437618 [Selaginella moellendorffii]